MADVIVRGVSADIAVQHWQGPCQRPAPVTRQKTRRKTRRKLRFRPSSSDGRLSPLSVTGDLLYTIAISPIRDEVGHRNIRRSVGELGPENVGFRSRAACFGVVGLRHEPYAWLRGRQHLSREVVGVARTF